MNRFIHIATTLCLGFFIYGRTVETQSCGFGAQHMRASIRHIEPAGIGYDTGYTTLELFLGLNKDFFVPFIDLRGHLFNDSKWAFNGGLGGRYIGNRIYGAQVYYDYRQVKHIQHANQIGVGIESLGTTWDFRLNGYFPFGKKKSDLYDPHFSHFSQHHMILKVRQTFLMRGVNGEIGVHFRKIKNWSFYAAGGPYYFEGQEKKSYGGGARVSAGYKEYIKLEISNSYDNIFHNNLQVQITCSIPFGPRTKVQSKKSSLSDCSKNIHLNSLVMQPVIRDEIIVVDSKHKHLVAIDPGTDQPLHFIFVNNQSHSEGTFKSPYSDLSTALVVSSSHDIIYIFSGDGTTKGLDAGDYQLQDFQQLLGSGINHPILTTLGLIIIPQMTGDFPHLTSTLINGRIVNVANNNRLAGLKFTAPAYILQQPDFLPAYAVGAQLGVATHNIIVTDNQFDIKDSQVGIYMPSLSGNAYIANNSIRSSDNQGIAGINLQLSAVDAVCSITNNVISGFSSIGGGSIGLQIILVDATGSASIVENTITQCTKGFHAEVYGISNSVFDVQSNVIDYNGTSLRGAVTLDSYGSSHVEFNFQNNEVAHNFGDGINLISSDASVLNAYIRDNVISYNGTEGIFNANLGILFASTSTSLCSVRSISNQIQANVFGGISYFTNNSGPLIGEVTSNRVENSSDFGLFLSSDFGSVSNFKVDSNAFIGNGSPGVLVEAVNGNLCLRLRNNKSDNEILLNNISGTFIFDTSSINNMPVPRKIGVITPGLCGD